MKNAQRYRCHWRNFVDFFSYILQFNFYYRPQTKFAKVMFLHVSVCPHGGSTWARNPLGRYTPPVRYTPGQVLPWAGTPLGRYTHQAGTPTRQVHPPPGQVHPLWEQCMLGDMGNKRAVHILLECILVSYLFG